MKNNWSVFLVLLISYTPVYADKDPTPMKEDSQQVTGWNRFFESLVKTHQWYAQTYSIKQTSSLGGYANNPEFYREVSYYNRQNERLLSRIRWVKDKPDLMHMIEVFIYDDKGRVSRDYLAAYLPEFRNAPIQTLINIHYYNDGLHAFRQFDASGALIYEQCKGRYFNEDIMLSIDEDEFYQYRDESSDSYDTYIACFEMLPREAGQYLKPYQAELKQQTWQKMPTVLGMSEYEDIDQRINKLTAQILTEPHNTGLYVARGDAWFKLHEFDKAVSDYDQALSIDKDISAAWFGRGMAYGRMGQIDKGIADLGQFIKRNPKSSVAYTKRGVRYLWKGDRNNAEKDLRKAIELNPNNAEAHDDLGVIHAQRGDVTEAISHFSKTIAIDPTYQKGHHNLAMAYHLAGENTKALLMIDKALAIKGNEKVSLLLKSQILAAQGKHQQAALLQDEAEYLPEGNWSELAPSQ